MLDKNENIRITMSEVRQHQWLNDFDGARKSAPLERFK